MKIGIVTDSTSDLPPDLIEEHSLEVIPTILILEGKEYADGEGISREEFYERLKGMKKPPTTAAPSIGEFTTRYQKLFAIGCDHILSIHAATQLTAIVNTARQAADEFADRITILDSGSLSMGLGFQVVAAAEAVEKGLQAAIHAMRFIVFLASLDVSPAGPALPTQPGRPPPAAGPVLLSPSPSPGPDSGHHGAIG